MMTNRILFLLLILPYILSQNVGPTILYISSSPDSVVAPVSSSLAGGTLIYLKVIGHNPMPSQNSIMVGSFPCIIPADGVIDTFISCYTTNSKSNLDISNLPVTLVSYSIPFTTSSPNLVSYAAAVTPQLTEVFPSVGWANRTIYFLGIHQISELGDGRSMGDVVGLRIGSDLCSLFDIVQGSINPATAQYIQCI